MKKRLPPFVPLLHQTLDTPAWRKMSASARCLYMALKRQDTGRNNGDIYLSEREAVKALGFTRPTIATGYLQLQHYGFVVMTSPGCLGVEGKGKAPHWRLTELEMNGEPPTRDFAKWDGRRFRVRKRQSQPMRRARPKDSGIGEHLS
jgi:hypothetical protein